MSIETVILIHGLARTYRSMKPMQHFLEKQGYKTINVSYPSRRYPIEELTEKYLAPAIHQAQQNSDVIHFVTHSMGGILLRSYLKNETIKKLGHTVMLCPPNGGSEIVDKLANLKIFSLINGPAGRQLGTGPQNLPSQLGPVNFPCGIIMGNKNFNPLLKWCFSEENDGKVCVKNAKITGMSDFLLLPFTHTFIMDKDAAKQATLSFLRKGFFS